MNELLAKITRFEAGHKDIAMIEELCDLMKNTSLCGLGQSAPNPVLSTLRYFAEEYKAHVESGQCPAGRLRKSSLGSQDHGRNIPSRRENPDDRQPATSRR